MEGISANPVCTKLNSSAISSHPGPSLLSLLTSFLSVVLTFSIVRGSKLQGRRQLSPFLVPLMHPTTDP